MHNKNTFHKVNKDIGQGYYLTYYINEKVNQIPLAKIVNFFLDDFDTEITLIRILSSGQAHKIVKKSLYGEC